ncbi:hypothetical protein P8C59_003608 [Phyllachora maydis]|uniref:Peroxisomal ATPase PEX6 n=1 Tax=Phyllachora maydis TaxID=1825666 RepID=A0AAD9I122_9PEZI|nr:hypothetical protein P8C59_003608 [Phyllachora maydis]
MHGDDLELEAAENPTRKRQDKPAVTARLVLDEHVQSDVGIVSEDLFADLFPHLQHNDDDNDDDDDDDDDDNNNNGDNDEPPPLVHMAIAPWTPDASPATTAWTIVPVTRSATLAPATVQFAPSALALQAFATALQQQQQQQQPGQGRGGIDILALDVAAVPLDTVFVRLEADARPRPGDEAALAPALRSALRSLAVVHAGDRFPLPLHPAGARAAPSPAPPAKVVLCEPVAQGVLVPQTRVVVVRGRVHARQRRNRARDAVAEDEDTANEQFFSAAEERHKTGEPASVTESDSDSDELETQDDDDDDDDDELSDDSSLDGIISLTMPSLPTASGSSTRQPGTPMTLGRAEKTQGVSRPMSVYSTFTATTARPDRLRPKGRLFKTQGLPRPIPPALLHPKTAPEDDEEARVYVHVRELPRVGCFSGDWVRIEVAEEAPLRDDSNGLGAWGRAEAGHEVGHDQGTWRPARVFGLPEAYAQQRTVTRTPRSRSPASSRPHGRPATLLGSQARRPSGSGSGSGPVVYLSPILLANMSETAYLRLSPLLPGGGKAAAERTGARTRTRTRTRTRQPPLAREVMLQQVRTPVPVERDVQTAVMAGLKWHFEKKLRVVKSGDLVAVPIDTQLGRALQEAGGDGSAVDQVLALLASSRPGRQDPKPDEVAWFRVGHVQTRRQGMAKDARVDGDEEDEDDEDDDDGDGDGDDEDDDEDDDDGDDHVDTWGSVARVDISVAHLVQSGSVTSRVPGTRSSNWRYYLGLQKMPSSAATAAARLTLEPEDRRCYVSPLRSRLRDLLAAATSQRAVHLKMPPLAILLTSRHRHIGKATTVVAACRDMGLHPFCLDAYDMLDEAGAGGSDVKTEGLLLARAERAMSCGPTCCVLLVRHVEALTADRMAGSLREVLGQARVLVATTSEVEKVAEPVRALFTHELEMGAPDEAERQGLLRALVDDGGLGLAPDVDLGSVALQTAALVAGDLVDLVDRAVVARASRLERLAGGAGGGASVRDVLVAGGADVRALARADWEAAVEAARRNFAAALGAPKIPHVTWADVGGLAHVQAAVRETMQLPLARPELFARGLKRRSGLLFYGPPGTGKTLLAKAVATEYGLNFFSVKGPELLNMYIGESEANVRRLFARARDARPCVVFFDELDSVAPKRGNQGDSGGVMDRIVSQLLAELDGMSAGGGGPAGDDGDPAAAAAAVAAGVFVIGATNRPDLLDPALLRPGRFDKMLYLGVPDTHDKQLTVLQALTRHFTLDPAVSLRAVAARLPCTYTGADLYALCSDAMLQAVTRQAAHVDARVSALNADPAARPVSTAYFLDHVATPADLAVCVAERDFVAAQRDLVPSVSAGELAHYDRVRAAFERGTADPQPGTDPNRKGKSVVAPGPEDEEGDDPPPPPPPRHHGGKGKGKAKAKATAALAGFGRGRASDDDGLYE